MRSFEKVLQSALKYSVGIITYLSFMKNHIEDSLVRRAPLGMVL